ncbi:mannosyltransferase [Scytonema hofmannii PCC 7110]|uniref:Mannosyltransferase n=1 Tax=Scytonema hofmannii PCC 7110 TaxID=128403 RepID=A0A139X2K9_9CYAN|nr:ABC transporter ATP-binding protein [Scytonema hofmannii]KYC38914.1 mannosyltransferase [Scytonema hofmannii PCC 7110]
MSTPIIATQHLSISYWSQNKRIEALQDISLTINAGEFVTLIGSSGCGKSTLLNAIAGLVSPSAHIEGTFNTSGIKEIGYLFQKQTLLPWHIVVDNVTAPLEIRGVPRTEGRKKALVLLAKYGLYGFEHNFPKELSGGMQQRVLLIRTLIYEPDVVLLDEPLSSLDAQTRALLQDELLRLWRDTGCTFVLVTHDLDEAIALSQRVFLLSARPGRIVKKFKIDLPTERSALTIRTDPKFQKIQREMWSELTTQVLQQQN